MKRKILQELIDWKNKDNRAPLLLYGARQVGKTYIALEFGRDYFGNTIYLNFEDSQALLRFLKGISISHVSSERFLQRQEKASSQDRRFSSLMRFRHVKGR